MASERGSRLLLAAAALAVVSFGLFTWLKWRQQPDPSNTHNHAALFRECASAVGITFQMKFLPNEQGENFKINLYDHGCGLAVADVDGDGHEDVYFVNQLGPNALYRNRGDGTFEDVTERAGVAVGDRICVAATFADYDNDGRPDLYVTSTRGGNILFHNLGGGRFEDVTKKAGLTHVGHCQSALFFDYDNDGNLDLYLTNTAQWTTDSFDDHSRYYVGKGELGGVMLSPKEFNVLYHNNGNGTFTNVTEKAGLEGRGWAGDAVAFDYDEDGAIDLFVTCMFGPCQLYRNNRNGTFSDVTLKVFGRTSWGAVGARVFDHDNDGRLDLFVVDMHSDMWMGLDSAHVTLQQARELERKKFNSLYGPRPVLEPHLRDREQDLGQQIGFRHEEVLFGNSFFHNLGKGKFAEISDKAGLETFWPWGIACGDFDNDGYEDVFLPTGMGFPFYYWPNYLLMNQGDGTFRNDSVTAGIEPPQRGEYSSIPFGSGKAARSSRCAVTADFDGDGRLEVVTNNFNDQPYYYRNQFPAKNYLALRLRGTRSNRDAIGTVVRIYQGDRVLTRQVHGACGYLSQSSRTLHFGLGSRKVIDRIEITWPSGLHQRLDGIQPNRLLDIVEPAGEAK